MENGVEALHMAFGMFIFILALSIALSAFGNAAQAMQRIWELESLDESYVTDGEGNYLNYVSFSGGTRRVGIETILPTMYRAYKENFAIYFYNKDETPMELYQNNQGESIYYIDLNKETHASSQEAISNLENILLKEGANGKTLYSTLSQNKFIEKLGEYYMDDEEGTTDIAEVNKTKKRVIVYIKQ